jgi:hypothetical protein
MGYPYYATGARFAGPLTQQVAVSIHENCEARGDLRFKIDIISGYKVRSKSVREPSQIVDGVTSLIRRYPVSCNEGDLLRDASYIAEQIATRLKSSPCAWAPPKQVTKATEKSSARKLTSEQIRTILGHIRLDRA